MMHKPKTILVTLVLGLILLTFSCDDQSQAKKESTPSVVSGKISQPVIETKAPAEVKKDEPTPENNPTPIVEPEVKADDVVLDQKGEMEKNEEWIRFRYQHEEQPLQFATQNKSSLASYRPIIIVLKD